MSRRSLVSTNRPNGILPGGKVRHVPPPAVEASVSPEVAGVDCADGGGTGVAAVGDDDVSLAANAGGVTTFAGGPGADCWATAGSSTGNAVGIGDGEAPFFFFASFPFGVGVGFTVVSCLCGALTIAGV